jgi:hypothetical protein
VKRAFLAFLLVCAGALAGAQTVTVSAQRFGGTVPFTGIISWQPTLANGTPASVQMAGGGQTTTPPLIAYVAAGAFTLTVPATDLTNPQNLCFRVTALVKGVNVLGPGYSCVQPHYTAINSGDWCQVGRCDFDKYIPSLNALPVMYGASTVLQITLTDAASLTLANGNRQYSAFALPLNAAILYRTLNVTGLLSGESFTLLISPDPTATAPIGIGFGSGCNWQAATGGALGSLSNGIVFPPGATAQIILAVNYDGTYCNVTEVQ